MSRFGRNLVFAIFLYTCVEGLVINVMYPNYLAFIFKDFAILLLYLGMMGQQRLAVGSLRRLTAPFTIFALAMFFYLVLPSPIGVLGEAVALKQRLFYIPLCYAGYHFTRDEQDLKALLLAMAWSSIPVGAFGVYLFFAGPAGLTALGANYSAVFYSTTGEHGMNFFRVPGTFTSPGQFGMFLLTHGVLFIGVLAMPAVSRSQRMVTVVAMVVVVGALLASGSRSPLLMLIMCGSIMLVLMGKVSGLGVWAVGAYSVLTTAYSVFGDGVRDRVGSIASWDNVQRFQDTYFGDLFMPYLRQSALGFGLGTATLGARHFTAASIWLVESYLGLLAVETGIVGLLAGLYLTVAIAVFLVASRSAMEYSPARALWYASSLLVFFITCLVPINTSLDSAPGNLYYWFFLGVSARLLDLERARLAGLRQPAAVYPGLMGQPA